MSLFSPARRRLPAVFLAAMLALSCAGCGQNSPAGLEYDDSIVVPAGAPDTPFACNALPDTFFPLQDGFYRFDVTTLSEENGLLLCYGDWASARLVPLCSQPNCPHSDAGCTAFFAGEWWIAAAAKGHLLLEQPLYSTDGLPLEEVAVWRVSADGSSREQLATLPESTAMGGTSAGVIVAECSEGFWCLSYQWRKDGSGFEKNELLFYSYSCGKIKTVCELPADQYILQDYGVYNNRFYYENADGLYAIDLTTGEISGPLYTRSAFPGPDTAGQNLLRRGGTLYIADDADYALYTLELETPGAQPVLRCTADALLEDELHQLSIIDALGSRMVVRRYNGQWAVDLDTGELTAVQAAGLDPEGAPYYPELAAPPAEGSDWLLMYGYLRQQTQQSLGQDGTLYSSTIPQYVPCRVSRSDYLCGVLTLQELDSAL